MAKIKAIMRNAGIFLFGVGLAALGAFLPGCKSLSEFVSEMFPDLLKNMGGEFASDVLEKAIDQVFLERDQKEFTEKFEKDLTNDSEAIKQIFRELKEKLSEAVDQDQKKGIGKLFAQLRNRKIEREFWEEIFVNIESSDAVLQDSETYCKLESENTKKAIAKIFACVKRKYLFESANERDTKLIMGSLVSLREDLWDAQDDIRVIRDWFVNSAVPRVCGQYGEGATLQRIVYASRYERQYAVRECPVCGYDGARIYTDPKTNLTTCAACGSRVRLLEYSEPELYSRLSDLISTAIDGLSAENHDVKEMLKGLAEDSLTREDMKCLFEDYRQTFLQQMKERKTDDEKARASIEELLKKEILPHVSGLQAKIDEDRAYQETLSCQMKSFCEQMSDMYKYAKEQFGELGELRPLVENLCTKEYFEERTNVLSEDVRKAIRCGFQNTQALTESGMAQILARLDELRKGFSTSSADTEKLEQVIRDENAQLGVKITELQRLIENCNTMIRNGDEKALEAFRFISQQLNEIKNLQLGVNCVAGFKSYGGKVPDKYLIDEGYTEEFPCLYCGATAVHQTNEDQVCKCEVCGNKYKKIAIGSLPVLEKNMLVDPDDEDIATEEKIDAWRQKHTVQIAGNIVKSTNCDGEPIADGIYIIPDIGEKCPGDHPKSYYFQELYRKARVLIFHENLKHIDDKFFSQFEIGRLRKIVITKGANGWEFLDGTVYARGDVHVYGKTYMNQPIKVN